MAMRFQMRPKDGMQGVYLVSVDGVSIAVGNQVQVYANRNAAKAQIICDELNRGLLARIEEAAGRAQNTAKSAQARARMERRA